MANLEWHPESALSDIYQRVAGAATATALEIAERARDKAPSRKQRSKSPGSRNPLAIKPRAPSEFRSRADKTRAAELKAHPSTAALGSSEARFFRVSEGKFKGQLPESLIENRRGGLRGAISPERGGTLKAGIHAVEAVVDGTTVTASVRSEAPYSAPIEYGFHHHPDGKFVKGQPFMRPATEDERDGWNSGRRIRKG